MSKVEALIESMEKSQPMTTATVMRTDSQIAASAYRIADKMIQARKQ